jgi:hypothetical protein
MFPLLESFVTYYKFKYIAYSNKCDTSLHFILKYKFYALNL